MAFTISMVGPFQKEIEKSGGEVVDVVYYNPNQASYRAEVEQVFSKQPDGVFLPALLPDFTSVAKEVYRSGFETPMFTLTIAGDSEGKFLEAVGPEVAEGINHLQPTPPVDSDAYKLFLDLMGASEDKVFLFASNTFDQVAVLAMAIEKAGDVAPGTVADQIQALSNAPGEAVHDPVQGLELVRTGTDIDFKGAGSDVDFDERGDLTGRLFTHYRWQDGENEIVNVVE